MSESQVFARPSHPHGPDGRFLRKGRPAWLVVRDQLVTLYEEDVPYPIPEGQRGLARRLHRSQNTISLAIIGSKRLGIPPCSKLIPWIDKAHPKPGPTSRIRPQLLAMADRGNPYPGLRKLARRFNANTGNISRLIRSSDRLRTWRRDEKAKRSEGWPRHKRHEVAKAIKTYKDAGNKYTNEDDLAEALGMPKSTIHLALVDSKYTGEFRGWRAAAHTRPGPDSRILPKLQAKADCGEPFPGFRPLARELKCDPKTIRRLVRQNKRLRDWQGGKVTPGQTGDRPPAPEPPAAEELDGEDLFLGAMELVKRFHIPAARMNTLHQRLHRWRQQHADDAKSVICVEGAGPRDPHYRHSVKHVWPLIKDLATA